MKDHFYNCVFLHDFPRYKYLVLHVKHRVLLLKLILSKRANRYLYRPILLHHLEIKT